MLSRLVVMPVKTGIQIVNEYWIPPNVLLRKTKHGGLSPRFYRGMTAKTGPCLLPAGMTAKAYSNL
jgi:hypothetical protein